MNRARHFQPRKDTKYHETNPNLAWLRAALCFFVVNFLRLFVFMEFLRLSEFYKKALFPKSSSRVVNRHSDPRAGNSF